MKDLRDWYSYLERTARSAAGPSRTVSQPAAPSPATAPAVAPHDHRGRGRPGRRPLTETREEIVRRVLDPELSLHEAAALLNVSKATVRRYTDQGKLSCFRTRGGQRRFKLSGVLTLLEGALHREGGR